MEGGEHQGYLCISEGSIYVTLPVYACVQTSMCICLCVLEMEGEEGEGRRERGGGGKREGVETRRQGGGGGGQGRREGRRGRGREGKGDRAQGYIHSFIQDEDDTIEISAVWLHTVKSIDDCTQCSLTHRVNMNEH